MKKKQKLIIFKMSFGELHSLVAARRGQDTLRTPPAGYGGKTPELYEID